MVLKKIDLSTRNVARPTSPIPSFSRRNIAQGEIAASADIFKPDAACTVQWVLAQVSVACSLQLLESGDAVSGNWDLETGDIIRFPGLLLPNNAKLSLAVTGAATVTYEVAWTKDFAIDLMVKEMAIYTPMAPTADIVAETTARIAADSAESAARIAADALKAPLASPVFTGAETLDNATAATASVAQSSPIFTISGRYWNGSASALDSWTIQSVLTNGTNGASTLTLTHSAGTPVSGNSSPMVSAPGGLIKAGPNTVLWSGANFGIANSNYGGVYSGGSAPLSLISGTGAVLLGKESSYANSWLVTPTGQWAGQITNTVVWGALVPNSGTVTADTGISRLAAGSLAIGNGVAANATGKLTLANLKVTGLAVYANNAAAVAGGLAIGDLYRTGADPDPVCVVH